MAMKGSQNPGGIDKEVHLVAANEIKCDDLKANNWGSGKLHPLLIDNVMDVLFQYLPKNDLLKCREVCKMWENSSRNLALKKFKLTPIQFSSESEGQTVEKFAKMFESSAILGQPNLFQSFSITEFDILRSFGDFLSTSDGDRINICDFALKLFTKYECLEDVEPESFSNLNYTLKFLSSISSSLESFKVQEFEYMSEYFNSRQMSMDFSNLTKLTIHIDRGSKVFFDNQEMANYNEGDFLPKYFFQQIFGSAPKLSKLHLTILYNYFENRYDKYKPVINLSTIKSSVQELHLELDTYSIDFFGKDLDFKLKIFTFNLKLFYHLSESLRYKEKMKEFKRFCEQQANTLVELQLNMHIGILILNDPDDPDGQKLDLLPALPKLQKLKVFYKIGSNFIAPVNLPDICPALTHLEIGQNCIESIVPLTDIFKDQLISYKIV